MNIDFVIPGVPISSQGSSTSKANWKKEVATAAKDTGAAISQSDALKLSMVYFHSGPQDLDIDNVIKPVQDALEGVLYVDDLQITDVFAARRDLRERYRMSRTTARLARILASGANHFLYVEIGIVQHSEPLL